MQSSARIEELQVVGDHRLRLTLAPRLSTELELTADALKGAPAALADPAYFAQVKIDALGQLTWPNGFTLSYDAIYERAKGNGEGGASADVPAAGGDKEGPSLVTVAGAVASGLGVLGFVTFAGGVVLWSRFNEMGLPADHVLALVPKSELVATGADFLVPALLFSALAVLVIVLLSSTIDHFTEKWPPTRWLVAPVLLGVGELVVAVTLKTRLPEASFWVLVLIAGLGALAVSSGARISFAVFALAAFLAVGSFAIARTYELTSHRLKVLPMAYSRSQPGEAPRVELGYFVAETSDRILFASLPKDGKAPNELREFPRNETDDLEIGELADPVEAERNAARFAYNLCERLANLKPAAPPASQARAASSGASGASGADTTKPEPVCTGSYLNELAGKAGLRPVKG